MTLAEYHEIAMQSRATLFPDAADDDAAVRRKALDHCTPSIIRRATSEGWSGPQFRRAMAQAGAVITDLHQAPFIFLKDKSSGAVWHHQPMDVFKLGFDPLDLDYESLKAAAATYVSRPEIQCAYLDWVFLDALVFYELSLFGTRMLGTRLGTKRIDWAYMASAASRSLIVYQLTRAVFGLLWFGVVVVAPIWGAIHFADQNAAGWALALLAIPILSLGGWLISLPARRRVMRENVAMTATMQALYDHLGGQTISPRRLREMVDDAARGGVVLDGAVFALVDRMVAADPTAFVIPPGGS